MGGFTTLDPEVAVAADSDDSTRLVVTLRQHDGSVYAGWSAWHYTLAEHGQSAGACTELSAAGGSGGPDARYGITGLESSTQYTITTYVYKRGGSCATELASATRHTATPELIAERVEHASASLRVTGWSKSWYYRADKAPHDSCSAEQAASSVGLTGLTAGTEYTYTAYRDSSCSTEIDLTTPTVGGKAVQYDEAFFETSGNPVLGHSGCHRPVGCSGYGALRGFLVLQADERSPVRAGVFCEAGGRRPGEGRLSAQGHCLRPAGLPRQVLQGPAADRRRRQRRGLVHYTGRPCHAAGEHLPTRPGGSEAVLGDSGAQQLRHRIRLVLQVLCAPGHGML